jgi:hypothetical protein
LHTDLDYARAILKKDNNFVNLVCAVKIPVGECGSFPLSDQLLRVQTMREEKAQKSPEMASLWAFLPRIFSIETANRKIR